ncbi:MAG: flavodoxin domain-containing protein [Bacillota bacterium]|nr:flavodoxin domain-containing protein [Bacillota bacterium]
MRTLIAYSTEHGATRDYAEALARELSGEVVLVNLRENPSPDASSFGQVVIGSAIYAGQAQKEVRDFCARNLDALRPKRLGLFICCWFQDQAERQLQAAFPPELLDSAVIKSALGGRINLGELSFFERLAAKVVGVKGNASRYSEESARRFAQALKTESSN